MKIFIKRAYDAPSGDDGYRVLVDRLWPRGVKKEVLALDEWCKDVAPSVELRQWFGHDPKKFKEFNARYKDELEKSGAAKELLKRAGKYGSITLVYAARDPKINHALVLKSHIESMAR